MKDFHLDKIGIIVSVSKRDNKKRPFRLNFYDLKKVEDEGKRSDRFKIASSLDPPGLFWTRGEYWKREIKRQIVDSPRIDVDPKKAKDAINELFIQFSNYLDPLLLTERKEPEEKDEKIEGLAEELLESPKLITKLDKVMHHHFAGETKNALLTFLTILSCKLYVHSEERPGEPLNLSPSGEASVGKSFVVMGVSRLFPGSMILSARDFSKNAIWHLSGETFEDDEGNPVKEVRLDGKCIIITEEEGAEDFIKTIRPVLSRDEKVSRRPIGPMGDTDKTLFAELVGWPSYIGLRVGEMEGEQETTRRMKLDAQSGMEKYRATQRWSAEIKESPLRDRVRTEETKVIRNAISKLKDYRVLIPNRKSLQKTFPSMKKEHQRHWNYFQALVETVTLLHQRQRPVVRVKGDEEEREFLLSSPSDVEIAIRISKNALESTLIGVGESERTFWKAFRDEVFKKDVEIEGYSGLMEIYEKTFSEPPPSRHTLRRKYVDPLAERGLIEIRRGKGRRPSLFSLSRDISFLTFDEKSMLNAAWELDYDDSFLSDLEYRYAHSAEEGRIAVRGTAFDKIRHSYECSIENCEGIMGENPIGKLTKENMENLWRGLKGIKAAEENKEVLERDYDEDYGIRGREEAVPIKEVLSEKKPISIQEVLSKKRDLGKKISETLLWGGPKTIEEVRSKLDIEDTQFNEAWNRLAERGKIVPRGGKWVHRENLLGEP